MCSRQQWYGHVVKNHSIMGKNKDAIEDTIESPDAVYKSRDYDTRKVFFKESMKATYSTKFKTKVIVDYSNENHGEIVTAFPAPNEEGGTSDEIYRK